jgi:hypothetical protein
MGLLDDAIREHLDLKRRRGADPTEVERAEREALGPVRRDPFEHAEDEPQAELGSTEPDGTYDQAAEQEYEEHEPAHAPPLAEDDPFEEEEEPFAEDGEPFADEEPFAEDEPFAEERSFPGAPPAEGTAGEPTVEYDVERDFEAEHPAPAEHPPASEPPPYEERPPAPPAHDERPPAPPARDEPPRGEEDDVLEETPEFLQDAPEHDRLWFEQRPPKDFDFDG